jgi:hypothetical protein
MRDQLVVAHISLGQLLRHQSGQFRFAVGIRQGQRFDREAQIHFLPLTERVE